LYIVIPLQEKTGFDGKKTVDVVNGKRKPENLFNKPLPIQQKKPSHYSIKARGCWSIIGNNWTRKETSFTKTRKM